MSDAVDFILPDLGEGVHEAEIIAWKVNVGDTVEEMQVLAEMETDKALVEVPSPYAGTVAQLHGNVGDIAHVGNPIVTFEPGATQGGKTIGGAGGAKPKSGSPHPAPKAAPVPTTATQKPAPNGGQQPAQTQSQDEDAGTVVGTMQTQPKLGAGDGKVMATPAVRRLAREKGVDINAVRGTGRGGRVTASDIEKAARGGGGLATAAKPVSGLGAVAPAKADATHAALSPVAQPITYPPVKVDSSGTSEVIPIRGVRRKIAESLDRSVRTAVHFTVMDTADVTQLDRLRKQTAAVSGEKVSFLPFIVQAVCRALRQWPALNANVDDAKGEIHIKGVHNIGIAVDTQAGLMVPVVQNADRMGILPLGRKIEELAQACRDRTIAVDQLHGGTFTITNVGSYGGAFATPIINYPEVAILGAGRARESVMARNGGIFVGLELPLSLSCDHRIIDGANCARMLNTVVQLLENPDVLLEPVGR